jgi:hypothetical protein
MKRDMNLVRAILLKVEACCSPDGLEEEIEIGGYVQNEVFYHIKLLHEAGYLDARDVSGMEEGEAFCWWPGNLTWDGHDFLEAIKKVPAKKTAKK